MLFIKLSERSGIDLNNSIFHKGSSSNEFVASGVVSNSQNSGFSGDDFRSPREISRINLHCSELNISSSCSNSVDASGSQFGGGSRST